jgi:Flp pilus assembly protein protease CpaA
MLAEDLFLIMLAFIWIIAAVIQDFRKREVANWLNFSLVSVALAYRAFLSLHLNDYNYLLWGVFGFLVFVGLAYAFYYARVFAGGDAKLLMGMGAVLGFSNSFFQNIEIFLYFIVLFLVCGSAYGLLYSLVLAFKNRKKFYKEFSRQLEKNKKIVQMFFTGAIIFLFFVLIIGEFTLSFLSLMIFLFPFLLVYAKAIEESCLIVEKKSRELTLGDWLYKEVKAGKKRIKPDWEGLDEKELALLRKYKGKVLVKEGIPFTPAFLFAFAILIYLIKEGMLGLLYNLGI